MTMMNNVNPSLEDALEHHGVKGMHWGTKKGARVTTTDIHAARIRTNSRVHEINAQAHRTNVAVGKNQERSAKKLGDMHADFLKNPDRATALRMTRGEKAVATLIAVGIPGPGTLGVAAGVGFRVGVRKGIEKQIAKQN